MTAARRQGPAGSAGVGAAALDESSFARRVQQFDGVSANAIEREYLLGGGVSSLASSEYDPRVDHRDMTPGWVRGVVGSMAGTAALLSGGLLASCIYERTDAANADEKCPLLLVGMVVAAFSMLASGAGVLAASRKGEGSRTSETLFFLHHYGALMSIVMLVSLAVFTLMHWDIAGEPIHDLFHAPETVGVRYRFLIWGLALADALVLVVSVFGTLGRQWFDEDAVLRRTYVFGCVLQMLVGVSVFSLGLVMWGEGEVGKGDNPTFLIGSVVSGAALFAINALYIAADSVRRLTFYLFWLPVVALPVMAFSVANAVTAEPQNTGVPRHHNQLLSGLVGVWGQVFTVIAIVAGSRWRFYQYSTNLLPARAK